MHNPKFVQENETHKILWGFEIQTDHLISTRRPNQAIVTKKIRTCRIMNFGQNRKKSKKKDKYLDLAKERKKL